MLFPTIFAFLLLLTSTLANPLGARKVSWLPDEITAGLQSFEGFYENGTHCKFLSYLENPYRNSAKLFAVSQFNRFLGDRPNVDVSINPLEFNMELDYSIILHHLVRNPTFEYNGVHYRSKCHELGGRWNCAQLFLC